MKNRYKLILLFVVALTLGACRDEDSIGEVDPETEQGATGTYDDWAEKTHGNSVEPDYSVVFNQNEVLRFDIAISSEYWSQMQADLQSILGSSSGGRPGGGGPGGESSITSDPMWAECSIKFNDIEWYNVGVRFKGNSSLSSAYRSGNNKLSLKLDFDEFEDTYPELKNQRFYGFKQLNLNNNFDDASLIREKVAADLFREFGLASAHTTFCEVYVDHGNGSQYYGLYTLVEEVDDTVLDDQFADGNGNLYKPDGDAASFASGSYNETEMEKKTNEDEADYTDVKQLYDIINSSERTTDVNAWKTRLSENFDIDTFLKWLATNTVIQNWDTYGNMTHNYYLYNEPSTSKLTWIPWDNNEAFQFGKLKGSLSLELTEVGNDWPLISYIIGIEEYRNKYDEYVEQFITEVFVVGKMTTLYSEYHELLKDYAYAEENGYTFIGSDAAFDTAVETLKSHVQGRNTAVSNYLNSK